MIDDGGNKSIIIRYLVVRGCGSEGLIFRFFLQWWIWGRENWGHQIDAAVSCLKDRRYQKSGTWKEKENQSCGATHSRIQPNSWSIWYELLSVCLMTNTHNAGNAKTVRNDNSSRFVIFLLVFITKANSNISSFKKGQIHKHSVWCQGHDLRCQNRKL